MTDRMGDLHVFPHSVDYLRMCVYGCAPSAFGMLGILCPSTTTVTAIWSALYNIEYISLLVMLAMLGLLD